MSGRTLRLGGLIAAGGVGYYLYAAGGDPKAAEKRAEHDASRLSTSIKDQLPGRASETGTEAQRLKEDARSTLQSYSNEAQSRAESLKADAKAQADKLGIDAEKYKQDAGKELNKAVDAFDKKVAEGAEKAKGGISNWFGGK
ncbi:hypothetical protein K431DRAFT_308677 [Polychaeton citri CBS 116435]|uniref:Calcofluor white hypersensitive protein n=1 Tax=Polychaeton citri CBS 116435 TaxID=1314669 RepID=A0A9P4QHA0_9PEZI|nr:hypothetical protein K431DRAFT_308677 [Polychaeton citri CBS 116435]